MNPQLKNKRSKQLGQKPLSQKTSERSKFNILYEPQPSDKLAVFVYVVRTISVSCELMTGIKCESLYINYLLNGPREDILVKLQSMELPSHMTAAI